MAKPKFDGVIEAVRYQPDGQVGWVRAYLRRGPTFTDYMIIPRQALVDSIKSGKRYFIGKRLPYWAGTFEVTAAVSLKQVNGREVLIAGDSRAEKDRLVGAPIL